MKARTVLYWALWPVEVLVYLLQGMAYALQGFGRLLWFLIIVSNPLFLAIYLMNRRRRPRERQEH